VSEEQNPAGEEARGIVVGSGIDRSRPLPLLAILDAKPGHAAALRAMIVDLARKNRQEPGCVDFIPYEVDQIPGRFYLYEIFANSDTFEQHLDTDHVKEFRKELPSVSSNGPDYLVQLIEVAIP
jgi:quinol monooxygenase YgiN